MAIKWPNVSVFPNEIIKKQVGMLVNQKLIELEDENNSLCLQIQHVGKCLEKERKNKIKYLEMYKKLNTCMQDIDEKMRKVYEELEEQKKVNVQLVDLMKVNLQLIDLMKGDDSGVKRAPDAAM